MAYQKLKVLSSAERQQESRRLVWPNPGDLMISMIFAWGLFCFFMVTMGRRFLVIIARLTRSMKTREMLLSGDETALTILTIGGMVGIVLLVLFAYNYRKTFVGVLAFGTTYAGSVWKLSHDIGFILKYSCIAFLGAFGGLFILKNFWRLVSMKYFRLLLIYVAYIGAVCVLVGGEADDVWWVATDFVLIVGFAIPWFGMLEDSKSIEQYFMALVAASTAALIINLLSPLLHNPTIIAGRFVAVFNGATGFAATWAPQVVMLFWASMYIKNPAISRLFMAFALAGTVLLLWSGGRAGLVAMGGGVAILWWVFRTRIFAYIFGAAALGLIAQIIGTSGQEEFDYLQERFQRTDDNGRFDIWAKYLEIFVRSPLIGFAPTGIASQFFSDEFVSFLSNRGVNARYPGAHNIWVAMSVRFGAIGIGLLFLILVIPLLRARKVLFEPRIPLDEKKLYVLPTALIATDMTIGLAEANLFNGRGTPDMIWVFASLVVCEVHGRRLWEQYVVGARVRKEKTTAEISGETSLGRA